MNLGLTLTYIILAFVMGAAYVLVIRRHAVPKAPKAYHWVISAPMILSVVSSLGIAVMSRAGLDALFTIPLTAWRATLAWSIIGWLTVLIAWAYQYAQHGRNEEEDGDGE